MQLVGQRSGIDTRKLGLLFGERQLDHSAQLKDYNVKQGDSLFCVLEAAQPAPPSRRVTSSVPQIHLQVAAHAYRDSLS